MNKKLIVFVGYLGLGLHLPGQLAAYDSLSHYELYWASIDYLNLIGQGDAARFWLEYGDSDLAMWPDTATTTPGLTGKSVYSLVFENLRVTGNYWFMNKDALAKFATDSLGVFGYSDAVVHDTQAASAEHNYGHGTRAHAYTIHIVHHLYWWVLLPIPHRVELGKAEIGPIVIPTAYSKVEEYGSRAAAEAHRRDYKAAAKWGIKTFHFLEDVSCPFKANIPPAKIEVWTNFFDPFTGLFQAIMIGASKIVRLAATYIPYCNMADEMIFELTANIDTSDGLTRWPNFTAGLLNECDSLAREADTYSTAVAFPVGDCEPALRGMAPEVIQAGANLLYNLWVEAGSPPMPATEAWSVRKYGLGFCMGEYMECEAIPNSLLGDMRAAGGDIDVALDGGGYTHGDGTYHLGHQCLSWNDVAVYKDEDFSWPESCFSDGEEYTLAAAHTYRLVGVSTGGDADPKPFRVEYVSDFDIHSSDITFDPANPAEGDIVTIKANFRNRGTRSVSSLRIGIYDGDPREKGAQTISETGSRIEGPEGTVEVSWDTIWQGARTHDIYVWLDAKNGLDEPHKANNLAGARVVVSVPACYKPRDDRHIRQDAVLCPGIYGAADRGQKGVIIIAADDITLDCAGAELVGDGSGCAIYNPGFDNVTIKNCRIDNYGVGVESLDSRGGAITDTTIANTSWCGIHLASSDNSSITNNSITTVPGRTGVSVVSSHQSTIGDNNIHSGDSGNGISVRDSDGCVITRNTLTELAGEGRGIQLGTSNGGSADYTRATHNTVTGYDQGLVILNSHDVSLEYNTITSSKDGIALMSTVRRVHSSRKQGLDYCMGSDMECEVIANSELAKLRGGEDLAITVHGGGYTHGSGTYHIGHQCATPNEVHLYINDGFDWPDACLSDGDEYMLWHTDTYDFSGVSTAGDAQPQAFWVSAEKGGAPDIAAVHNEITSNTITSCERHGILLYFSADNTLDGNNLSSNGGYGMRFVGSSRNILLNNNIADTGGWGIFCGPNSVRNDIVVTRPTVINNNTVQLAGNVTVERRDGLGKSVLRLMNSSVVFVMADEGEHCGKVITQEHGTLEVKASSDGPVRLVSVDDPKRGIKFMPESAAVSTVMVLRNGGGLKLGQ